MAEKFLIVIPIYHEVNLFDVAAPRELFGWWANFDTSKDIEIIFASESDEALETYSPKPSAIGLKILSEKRFSEIENADLLWVPGGSLVAIAREMSNSKYISFIQRLSKNATYVASVCEGALIAAQAGLLNGFKATTHWRFIKCLSRFPEIDVIPNPNATGEPVFPRFVVDDQNGTLRSGIRITGGGISSAVDESLGIIQLIGGDEVATQVQRVTQYFPDPPISGPPLAILDCPAGVFPPE